MPAISKSKPCWLPPSAFLTAISRLLSFFASPTPFSETAHALFRLLRRYPAGLTLPVLLDELLPLVKAGGRAQEAGICWRGRVVASQGEPMMDAWVAEGVGGAPRLFCVLEERKGVVGVGDGVRVAGRRVEKVLGEVPVVEEVAARWREEGRGWEGEADVLLPTRAVVVEVSGGVLEELMKVRTLGRVWERKEGAPEWVGGLVVGVGDGWVELRDEGGVMCVRFELEGDTRAIAALVEVGERLLVWRPAVFPVEEGFVIRVAAETTVYVRGVGASKREREVAGGLQVLPPPPKRGKLDERGRGLDMEGTSTEEEADVEEALAESAEAVTVSRMLALQKPGTQAPFCLFGVACAVPVVAAGEVLGSRAVEVSLDGGVTVQVRCGKLQKAAVSKELALLEVGDGVCLSGVKFQEGEGGKEGYWCAETAQNVSRMPGFLNSPALYRDCEAMGVTSVGTSAS